MGKEPIHGRRTLRQDLGVIGCGNIGALVAERALALKMKVIAYDPFLSPERAVKLGVEKVELEELLSRADLISLHTPLTDKTKNILSPMRWPGRKEASSSSMPPGADWSMKPLYVRRSRAGRWPPPVSMCS